MGVNTNDLAACRSGSRLGIDEETAQRWLRNGILPVRAEQLSRDTIL
jgi:predicted site-specific integrase-resolvase